MSARLLPILCCFGDGLPAVAYVALDEGCACFPRAQRQYLCAQHLHESEPLGGLVVLCQL